MKILFVSVEVAPFAKVGGLADVAGSLPKALKSLGHDVRIAMPSYRMVEESPKFAARTIIESVPVQMNRDWTKQGRLKQISLGNVPVYLVGTDEWFTETVSSETLYIPGSDQYLFFSKALFAVCEALGWIPDILHCNDWHTGLAPVLLQESASKLWENTASVFTIHNLAYQGEFGSEILDKLDLPQTLFNMDQLETYGSVNFLKAGCVFSDQVNTVSPTYAREIQTPEFGCRLEGLMRHLSAFGRLSGILNGIDTEEFNPATDANLPARYSSADLSGKRECKKGLQEELNLPVSTDTPLMGVVSRLSSQKGMDLLVEAVAELIEGGAAIVVQGLGDSALAQQMASLQEAYPESFRFVEKFDAALAQRIYAGCDMFLMPSSFEPCGLGQQIALRYGTIPVVRHTGGLADTVFEGKNGFVFEERTSQAFLAACARALAAYRSATEWQRFVLSALRGDYSWSRSAREYVELYERALADHNGGSNADAG